MRPEALAAERLGRRGSKRKRVNRKEKSHSRAMKIYEKHQKRTYQDHPIIWLSNGQPYTTMGDPLDTQTYKRTLQGTSCSRKAQHGLSLCSERHISYHQRHITNSSKTKSKFGITKGTSKYIKWIVLLSCSVAVSTFASSRHSSRFIDVFRSRSPASRPRSYHTAAR